ncbi:MAG: histidine kinase, partial [Bacteroidetes bacterium]
LIHRDKGLFYLKENKIFPFFEKNPFKRPSDKIILTNQYAYNYTDQISLEIYDYKNKIYYGDSLIANDNLNQAFCVHPINDKLLVGRRKGLYILEKNQIKILPQFSKTPVFSIFHDTATHKLYIGSTNKIIVADDKTMHIQKVIPIDIPLSNLSQQFLLKLDNNISKIIVDKYNRIWFCIQPDDNLYLLENNQIYNALDVLKILPTLINDIYLDNFNNIWIATFNDGVYQITSTYWHSFTIKENHKILNTTEIEKYHRHILIATNNGLYITDTANLNHINPIIQPDNFFNNEITSLSLFANNLYCAHPTEFDKKEYRYASSSVLAVPFKYIAPITNNKFYVSDIANNVLLYNISKNKITDTIFKPVDYRLQIKHLFYSQQKLFISTNKGLLVFDEKNKTTTSYLQDNNVRKTIQIDDKILVLYENKILDYTSNQLWMDAEKYNIITLTDMKKWNDYYFVSSEEGLLLLDKNSSLINMLNRKNGLISNVINAILIHNNQIILATDKGISYTHISNLLHYTFHIYPPFISHIVTNTDTFFLSHSYPLTFSKNTQDIYFHILCPNYNPLTKTSFQYSFNNSDWINFDNSPLHFSSLAGGNYTLHIRATTDNIHYTQPFSIAFKKELNINEKEWFWELIIAISTAAILLSIYIIKKIEKKKSAEKLKNIQQMNLLKHQAMNAILSPHFIFNSLTGIQNYILKNDAEKASDYLSKFSRLIRMIIEKASQ